MNKAIELSSTGCLQNQTEIMIVRNGLEMQADSSIQIGDYLCVINNFLIDCLQVKRLENSHAICKSVTDVMVLNLVDDDDSLEWNTPLYISAKKKLFDLI